MPGEIPDASNADSKVVFERMNPARTPRVPPKENESKVTV